MAPGVISLAPAMLDSGKQAPQSSSLARSDWLPIRRAEEEQRAVSEIIIHDDENFERALKRFKKKCEKAGILSDLRKHRHYEKPSERRKRKMNAAIRKNRRTRTA